MARFFEEGAQTFSNTFEQLENFFMVKRVVVCALQRYSRNAKLSLLPASKYYNRMQSSIRSRDVITTLYYEVLSA